MCIPPTCLLVALLGLSQCKKSNPDPVDQLPAAARYPDRCRHLRLFAQWPALDSTGL